MGRIAIAVYRPKPGKESSLRDAIRDHQDVLRGQGLVTGRPAWILRAKDGSYLEVFEWESPLAIQRAHANPTVQALWARFADACDYIPLSTLDEAHQLFAEFDPASV